MSPVIALATLALLVAGPVLADDGAAPTQAPAAAAYVRLSTLAGRWETTTPKGTVIRLTFEPIARASALVERYEAGTTVTQTVYHLDDERLLLTHYCAQGNQPRLVAVPAGPDEPLAFTFLDATNLGEGASHMVACSFVLTDTDHFIRSETYRGVGGDDTTTRTYTRVTSAP